MNKKSLNKILEYLVFHFRIYEEIAHIAKRIKQIFHAVHAKSRIINKWVHKRATCYEKKYILR